MVAELIGYSILLIIVLAYGSIVWDDFSYNLHLAKKDGENVLSYSLRYWLHRLFIFGVLIFIYWFVMSIFQ